MEVDQKAAAVKKPAKAPLKAPVTQTHIKNMRESFRSRMELKRKRIARPVKLSTKQRVISKGTSYGDKDEVRRRQRLQGSKTKGLTNACVNRLSQKHSNFNYNSVAGIAMTQ